MHSCACMSNQSPSKSLISISLNQYWIRSSLIQWLSLRVKSSGLSSQKVLLFCFRFYTYILHNTALVFNQLSETLFHVIVWLFLVSFSGTQLYHPTRRLTRQDNTPINLSIFLRLGAHIANIGLFLCCRGDSLQELCMQCDIENLILFCPCLVMTDQFKPAEFHAACCWDRTLSQNWG